MKNKRQNHFTQRPGSRRDPLLTGLYTSVAKDFCNPYNPIKWRLQNLDSLDYIKYEAFFKNSTIFNITLFKHLFDEWDQYEMQKFEHSGTNNYLISNGLLSDISKMLAALKRRFPSHIFGDHFQLESKSPFEQLFIAAYNDVYFELGVDRWRGEPEEEIDPRSFELTKNQLAIIEAILNMNEASTRTELQRLLMDQNFGEFETEYSFKLACYLAFHQKHAKMNRDWNHTEFYTDPFISEKKNRSFPMLAMGVEELAKCKKVMRDVMQTSANDEGKYCFTSYRGWNNSLSPQVSMNHTHSIKVSLSALNAVDLESSFIRFVAAIKPSEGGNSYPSSEPILVRMPPGPASGPPSVVFRDKLKVENSTVNKPDVSANFPGGEVALDAWLKENIKYPAISKELGDQGRVFVKFEVEVDGTLSKIQPMRGGVTSELNNEAMRLVRAMPNWIPGELNGTKVRTQIILPVSFILY